MRNFCLEMLSNAEPFQGTGNVEPGCPPCRVLGSLVLPCCPGMYRLQETWGTFQGWEGSGVLGPAGRARQPFAPSHGAGDIWLLCPSGPGPLCSSPPQPPTSARIPGSRLAQDRLLLLSPRHSL